MSFFSMRWGWIVLKAELKSISINRAYVLRLSKWECSIWRSVKEKANEYNIPLYFTIVDYENAFDSIEFEPLFEGLKNQDVDEAYLNIMRNLYSEATFVLRLHNDHQKLKLGRGAKQGNDIPPKLFTSCLQYSVINKINWGKQRY